MTPPRRIAAAALVAALGLGFVGIGAGPATAGADTTWGYKIKGGTTPAPNIGDTTWGFKKNLH